MVRQWWQFVDRTASARAAERHIRPIRLETELPVRPWKPVKIMRLSERRLAIKPALGRELGKCTTLGYPQHLIDQPARAHVVAGGPGAKTSGEGADQLVIVAAFPGRFNQFGSKNEILVPASPIAIVVLEKRRRRKHNVRHLRCLRLELLMDADEQILASEALLDLVLVGRNRNRIGVLDDQRLNGTTALQRLALAGEDRADARLVKHTD